MQTLQEKLKEQTKEVHEQAESHPLMKSFISGDYKKTHLFQYLVNLRPLYESIEQKLIVKNIHKNFDLCRSRLLSKDIAALYKEGIVNDDNINILDLKKRTIDWVANQWQVDAPSYLVSDFYVRWLADLYGGRVFARTLAPYTNTYQVNDIQRAITDVRDIINNTDAMHDIIVIRAKTFFEFHIDLFDEIYAS
jgi:heme oxygenase